jgi:hypothetical protein
VSTNRNKTPAEVGEIIDQNEKTVRRWVAEGCPHDRTEAGHILLDEAEVFAWCRANGKTFRRGRPKAATAGNVDSAKLRKENALATKYEIAVSRELRQLIPAAEIDREWVNIAAVVRNGFQSLASQIVPLALTHGMPHESAGVFQQQVEEAVNGILRHLSRDDEGAEDNEGVEEEILSGAVPEGAVDTEPVGGELPSPQS